ncbi:MAG: hypothetical protein HY754_05015 [Nitrospirae bacterium]|nr:hypothetical protein [Nitrospirota bacterium]
MPYSAIIDNRDVKLRDGINSILVSSERVKFDAGYLRNTQVVKVKLSIKLIETKKLQNFDNAIKSMTRYSRGF